MLRELIRILLDRKTIIDKMGIEFMTMLKTGRDMFVSATDLLYLGGDDKEVYEKIYPQDKELNKLECKIRSEVVTHISASGADNLATMLIFMSVVKDAERIGDYIKNTYEVAVKVKDFKQGKYGKQTLDIRNEIVSKFGNVMAVFSDSDEKAAIECVKKISKMQKQCDGIIDELLTSKTENSAAYALVVRYFKRILAHLSNIVTAVIMPVNKLDYFDEDSISELHE